MKNDREFTGTLLGFDDFVSKSLNHVLAIVGISSLLHRYGSRGRYRVVCPSFPPHRPPTTTPFVTRLTHIPFARSQRDNTKRSQVDETCADPFEREQHMHGIAVFFDVALWMGIN
jgi:small nuclear ribonucleoprotein (snRNP)-like protein